MGSFPKTLAVVTVLLFVTIGLAAYLKSPGKEKASAVQAAPVEVVATPVKEVATAETKVAASVDDFSFTQPRSADGLPDADRIEELFNRGIPQLPIVETITYNSRVDWLKGRPAWVADYSGHYKTSRHFIARSLNGKADYLKQDVFNGDQFNVLRSEKDISFHLLVDSSRCKMWFYYVDHDTNERVLLKRYDVTLGRPDKNKASGLLTPLGKFSLGDKFATYKPGATGFYLGNKIEMITVFGTRWIPFEQGLSGCTAPAKGLGIHGAPKEKSVNGEFSSTDHLVGGYDSDGCIRLATEDMEEVFSIIVSRPTVIEIVKDFHEANLPGVENNT